jgi:predicted Rossmann fold nucleotide-binding protein DprA/Smf involved in DNA uptake
MPVYISREDSSYPSLLKNISRSPKELWVEGDVSVLNEGTHVAVVGARD